MAKKKNKKDALLYTIPMEQALIYHRLLQTYLDEDKAIGLIGFIKKNFSKEQLSHIIDLYQLGLIDKKTMIFPFIDIKSQLRCLKRMKYGEDGKRCKNGKKSIGIGFICESLKVKGIIPAAWSPKQCLFGEHLINKYPSVPIIIVESEKTALICSMLFPDYIWLATGGCGHIKSIINIRQILSKRKVLLIPDIGEYDFWKAKTKKHSLKYKVSNYMELGNHEWNTDLADLIIGESAESYLNEIKLHLNSVFCETLENNSL